MARKFYHFYKKLFDVHIENSTLVVVIISMLIIFVWLYVPQKDLSTYSKASIFEVKNNQNLNFSGKIVVIDGKRYIIYLVK